MGKTVLLNEVEGLFLAEGWFRVSLTATPSLLGQLRRRGRPAARVGGPGAAAAADQRVGRRGRRCGLGEPAAVRTGAPAVGRQPAARRARVRERGLLVTIDEVHGGSRADVREIAALSQHLVREDRQFALAMAGLPSAVSNLLSDLVLTFLRRADRTRCARWPSTTSRTRSATPSRPTAAGSPTRRAGPRRPRTMGYPFLVQLVGYQAWRSTDAHEISAADVERAVGVAKQRLRELVHETALNDLSDVDRDFLAAMAVDDGPSRIADVAKRLGKDSQYANTYRGRLMAAGVIESPARGKRRPVDPLPRERDSARDLAVQPVSRRWSAAGWRG